MSVLRRSVPPPGSLGSSIVLKPYVGSTKSFWTRILTWLAVVLLVLFCVVYGFAFALLAPFIMLPFSAPLVILGALTIWNIPRLPVIPDKLLETLFFASFISLIVWPNYLAVALPGLPWITMLRLTGFPLVFVFVLSVSGSEVFRRRLGESLSALPILWKLLLVFSFIQLFSIALSSNPGNSIQKFIVAQTSWTCVFFVSAYLFRKPGLVERWAFLLWLAGIWVCIIGLWEYTLGHVPWAGHIPTFLQIEDESVLRMLAGGVRQYSEVYRVQSTFGTSLGLAEFEAMTIPFVLHFAFGDYRMLVRLTALASVPFLLFSIISTDARLGSVGFLVACLLYSLGWAVVRWRRHRGSLFGPAFVMAYPLIFSATVAVSLSSGRIRARILGNGPQQASNDARLEQLNSGLPLIIKNPLGYGSGQGAVTLNYHEPSGLLTIDNYYLTIALEYGVIGFMVYYGMVLSSIYYAGKHVLAAPPHEREFGFLLPIMISLINFVIIKSVFSQQESHPLIFMMLGMIVALAYRIRKTNASR